MHRTQDAERRARGRPTVAEEHGEMAYLVTVRGLSIEDAAELVGCDPSDMSWLGAKPVCYLPLPAEIEAATAELKASPSFRPEHR